MKSLSGRDRVQAGGLTVLYNCWLFRIALCLLWEEEGDNEEHLFEAERHQNRNLNGPITISLQSRRHHLYPVVAITATSRFEYVTPEVEMLVAGVIAESKSSLTDGYPVNAWTDGSLYKMRTVWRTDPRSNRPGSKEAKVCLSHFAHLPLAPRQRYPQP
jgi:hypothetical protein